MTIRSGLPYTLQGSQGRKQKVKGRAGPNTVITPGGWKAPTITMVSGLQTALDAKQATASKGAASGYAGLGSDGYLPAAQLPPAVPLWVKYTKTYTQLAAAALSNDIELFSLPARGFIHAVHINPTVAFVGGTIATYTVSVGNAGNLARYCTALSVFTVALQVPQALPGVESMSGATSIRLAAVATLGLLDTTTAGSVDVYVLQSVLPAT